MSARVVFVWGMGVRGCDEVWGGGGGRVDADVGAGAARALRDEGRGGDGQDMLHWGILHDRGWSGDFI